MSNSTFARRPDKSGSRPADRNGRDGQSRAFSSGHSRRNSQSQADRPGRPRWTERIEDDAPAAPRPPRGAGIIAEACELDRELIRLIAKRSRLLAKLPARQAGSGNADNERDLRLSWEKNASRVSRDPRLIRQIFALLREVEVLPADLDQPAAFNLAPARKALEVDLPAPASDRRVRAAMILAAASGTAVELTGVPLNNPVVECVKMINQIGGSLRWEEDGRVLCREGSPVAGLRQGKASVPLDKVIHVGEDLFNLYLLLFFMTTRPARIKVIGEGDLKLADLAALRRFLPRLGARLTAVIPGGEGLPARLETSALLPAEVDVPADLPADALLALCLSAAFHAVPVVVRAGDHPDREVVLPEAAGILAEAGIAVQAEAGVLRITPGRVAFHRAPATGLDAPAAAALLAMPAFAGGSVRLSGARRPDESPAEKAAVEAVLNLLTRAGVRVDEEDGALIARPAENAEKPCLSLRELPEAFFPLGLVLAVGSALQGGRLPALPEQCDMALVDDFLLQMGLVRSSRSAAQPDSQGCGEQPEQDAGAQNAGVQGDLAVEPAPEGAAPAPWTAPNASWGLALALAAFLRPNIRLTNPGIVTARTPDFWNIYNTLPAPAARPGKTSLPPQEPAKPARRRVFADYMPESERPEPLPYEEDV